MEKEAFIKRLVELRMNKGVSARDMSLSIGQSQSYINNIENGVNLPSMTIFFYICEYLGITPKEFFDIEAKDPTKESELLDAVKGLDREQLDNLITLATVELCADTLCRAHRGVPETTTNKLCTIHHNAAHVLAVKVEVLNVAITEVCLHTSVLVIQPQVVFG